jgi:hypothetical protein
MASIYRGLYRIGPRDTPTDVKVQDPGGNTLPLPIKEYVSRDVYPDWRDLPTQKQYQALVSVSRLQESGTAFINPADAEACVDAGWLDPLGSEPDCFFETGR